MSEWCKGRRDHASYSYHVLDNKSRDKYNDPEQCFIQYWILYHIMNDERPSSDVIENDIFYSIWAMKCYFYCMGFRTIFLSNSSLKMLFLIKFGLQNEENEVIFIKIEKPRISRNPGKKQISSFECSPGILSAVTPVFEFNITWR